MNETRRLLWLLPVALLAATISWLMKTDPSPLPEPPKIDRPGPPPDPEDQEAFQAWLAKVKAYNASQVATQDQVTVPKPPLKFTEREAELQTWTDQRKMIGHRFQEGRRHPDSLVLLRIESPVFEDIVPLKEFPNLRHLDLLFPEFDQRGWRLLSESTSLTRLLAYKNRVTIPPDALTRLEIGETLILRNCRLEEGVPLDPEKLTTLRWLEVSNCPVTTQELLVVADLPDLEILDVENTQVDDGIFELIKGLTKLRILRLNGTSVTDEALNAWKETHPDVEVNGSRPQKL